MPFFYSWTLTQNQGGGLRREVDLAVEAGKRLHISLGRGSINDLQGGAAFIGLTILDRSARAASNGDRPPMVSSGDGVLTILSQDTLQYTYQSLVAEQRYDPTNARLTGLTPLAYAAGCVPIIQDEHVSANIFAGHLGTEVALLTEAGARSQSLTVAGTDSIHAQAVLFALSDEPLLGEELYAAGAYLGAGLAHSASLRYCNPEYDKMYDEQRTTTDPDERWEIVHERQRMFHEDCAYAVLWYSPTLSAWRSDTFTGYRPQPNPGDPLEGWGGPSAVWWTLKPIGAGGTSTETKGIPAAAWIGIIAGVVIIIAGIVLGRRRRSEEEGV